MDRAQALQARFRVDGKEAELWHPDTGVIEPADYSIEGGRTTVSLYLGQRESVFVVFRRPAASRTRALPPVSFRTIASLSGPWELTFPPDLGAPEKIKVAKLESWTANPDEGVKYFSGTATYTKTVQVARDWLKPGSKLLLDLGTVKDVAQVSVNGRPVATLWKPPYEADVSGAVKAGKNLVEIKVTNQWTNRQAGDRSAPPEKRVLAPPAGGAAGPGPPQTLSDSGLLGPVTLRVPGAGPTQVFDSPEAGPLRHVSFASGRSQ